MIYNSLLIYDFVLNYIHSFSIAFLPTTFIIMKYRYFILNKNDVFF